MILNILIHHLFTQTDNPILLFYSMLSRLMRCERIVIEQTVVFFFNLALITRNHCCFSRNRPILCCFHYMNIKWSQFKFQSMSGSWKEEDKMILSYFLKSFNILYVTVSETGFIDWSGNECKWMFKNEHLITLLLFIFEV